MPVKPGDILQDRLRIDALIGRGGMGQVFAATDLDARTHVAVKVVSRLFVDETLMLRLHREAVAAQRIQSDYVPQVYEVGDTADGETFLVMERLMGEPLSARIRAAGQLQWTEVSRVGEEILRGLIDAHAAGVIHRDLKPSNVFLALKTGRVRAMVLDFGVCKMDGLDTERLTGTGESIGTVAYMAPEQIRGAAKVDERADIYAFGVLVFEMLTGRLPHEGPSQMAILASKLENESAALRSYCRFPIPDQLDKMVTRALSRDPAGRPASAMELLREWRALAREEFTTGNLSASVVPPSSAGSRPPRSHHDDDPPTEISKPDAVPPHLRRLVGTSSDDEELPATRTPVDFEGLLPPEKYPTNEPFIQGPASNPAGAGFANGQGAKVAMMIAIAASLAALCVLAFTFSRPDPPVRPRVAATAPPPAPVDPGESEPVLAPPAPADEVAPPEDMELPASSTPSTRSSTPTRRPPRPRAPAPAPTPRPKQAPQQGITTDPRY